LGLRLLMCTPLINMHESIRFI